MSTTASRAMLATARPSCWQFSHWSTVSDPLDPFRVNHAMGGVGSAK